MKLLPTGEAPPLPPAVSDRVDRGPEGPESPEGLPAIICNDRQLRDITTDVLRALRPYGGHRLFIRGSVPVDFVRNEEGRIVVRGLSVYAMRAIVGRIADFFRMGEDGPKHCNPPLDVIRELLALPPTALGLPPLEGIIEAPALRPDGTVIDQPGYDPSTSLFYAPAPGLIVPPIPNEPTRNDLRTAIAQIEDVLIDFPFVDRASKANAIGTLFTPIVRPAISGPVPLALFNAPRSGTGKGLLCGLVSLIATGRAPSLLSVPPDAGEWRKTLTAVLRESPAVVVIDEVRARLDSAELCKALTADCWADRTLGRNRIIHLPVRCSWLALGNDMLLGADLPRRCYWVQMDAGVERPWERTGFKYEDIKAHVTAHRGELIAALLTLARGWYAAGTPCPDAPRLGGFESWVTVVGGVLQTAGVEGFLANTGELNAEADTESAQWEVLLLALHDVFGEKPFTAAEVLRECKAEGSRIREFLPDFVAEVIADDDVFPRRLGKCLSDRAGRRFGESRVRVERAGVTHHAVSWRVFVGGS